MMKLTLLPNERVLRTTSANALYDPSRLGMSQLGWEPLQGLLGAGGVEGVGGRLRITTLRLVFQPHRVNRIRGHLSIPLSSVRSAARYRSRLTVGVEVETVSTTLRFVTWRPRAVLAALDEARGAFGLQEEATVAAASSALRDLDLRREADLSAALTAVGVTPGGTGVDWFEFLSLHEWWLASAR